MKILIHNDGKEKSFSWEASLENGVVDTCFGASKEKAIEDLNREVNILIKKLQNINFDDILQVDCFGNSIGAGNRVKT